MQQHSLEFLKLDETDRKVLLWLIDHVQPNAIKSWIAFIGEDYSRRKGVQIDKDRLFKESQESK